MNKYSYIFIFLVLSLASCNLSKEVEIELPEYEIQPVLECYLQPGEPFSVLITRSTGFFDEFDFEDPLALLWQDAVVTIAYDNQVDTLTNELFFNILTGKLFNYVNPTKVVPNNYSGDFVLNVLMPDGKTITGRTNILPIIPIDSSVVEYNEDSMARIITYFSDIPGEDNYFRRMIHENALDSFPNQDFAFDDGIVDNGTVATGSGYDFEPGTIIYNTLIHMDLGYYDFIRSIDLSIQANGNPFGQPGQILSNIDGTANPIGIFTGLSMYRESFLIE